MNVRPSICSLQSHRYSFKTDEKIFLTWREYLTDTYDLLRMLQQTNLHFDCIFGVPRGGSSLALFASHALGVPLTLMQPLDLLGWLKRSRLLVIDDIIDTGEQVNHLSGVLPHPKDTMFAAVYYRPDRCMPEPCVSYMTAVSIDRWIVFPYEQDKDRPFDPIAQMHSL